MNVMIIGGGKVGEYLTEHLLAFGHQVKLIEEDRQNFAPLQAEFGKGVAVCGNGTDPEFLEANGIRNMDVVAAVTGLDETNLVVSSLARFEFEVPRIIARVNHPKNAWMFSPEMGVDVSLNQADLIATMIAEEMSVGDMMLLHKLRKGQFTLVEEKVAPEAAANGKTIAQLNLPADCIIAAILRKGEMILPRGEVVLAAYDEVIAIVHSSKLQQLAKILGDGI